MPGQNLQSIRHEAGPEQATAAWLKYDELCNACDRCLGRHCTSCPIAKQLERYER